MTMADLISNSKVTIRCFQPQDTARCRTMFAEGLKEKCVPAMKVFFLQFLTVTAISLLAGAIIGVNWSVWSLLVSYFAAFVVMAAATYISVRADFICFINNSLNTDLLDIEKYYDGHDSCMFVAECDGRVIGMVGVATKEHHEPGVAELQRMSVCSSARGKRIGTMLMNKVIEYCKERKYDKIILSTLSTFYAAIALYRKHGFKIVNRKHYLPRLLVLNYYILYFEKEIILKEVKGDSARYR